MKIFEKIQENWIMKQRNTYDPLRKECDVFGSLIETNQKNPWYDYSTNYVARLICQNSNYLFVLKCMNDIVNGFDNWPSNCGQVKFYNLGKKLWAYAQSLQKK